MEENHYYEARDRTAVLSFNILCTCSTHLLLSCCLTGLVCFYGGRRWAFVCQTVVLSVTAAILAGCGIRGARYRIKALLIFFTIFGMWSLSAHVSYLYSNAKLDRVGELMCEEFKEEHRNSTENPGNCAESSIEAGYWVSIAQSAFWFFAVLALLFAVWNSFLLTGCLNETSGKLTTFKRHIHRIKKIPNEKESRCAKCKISCCGQSKGHLSGSYFPHQHKKQYGGRKEGVLDSVLTALELSATKQADRTITLCVIQILLALGTLSENAYEEHKYKSRILSVLRSSIAPMVSFFVPLVGIYGARRKNRNAMNIFVILEMWALCCTSSYLLTTVSIASTGSLMCDTLLASDQSCLGLISLGYMRLGFSMGLLGSCLLVSYCSFALSEDLRVVHS